MAAALLAPYPAEADDGSHAGGVSVYELSSSMEPGHDFEPSVVESCHYRIQRNPASVGEDPDGELATLVSSIDAGQVDAPYARALPVTLAPQYRVLPGASRAEADDEDDRSYALSSEAVSQSPPAHHHTHGFAEEVSSWHCDQSCATASVAHEAAHPGPGLDYESGESCGVSTVSQAPQVPDPAQGVPLHAEGIADWHCDHSSAAASQGFHNLHSDAGLAELWHCGESRDPSSHDHMDAQSGAHPAQDVAGIVGWPRSESSLTASHGRPSAGMAGLEDLHDVGSVEPTSPGGNSMQTKGTFWSDRLLPFQHQAANSDVDPSVVATSCAGAGLMLREPEPRSCYEATCISDATPREGDDSHTRLEHPLPRYVLEQSSCSLSTAASCYGDPPHVFVSPPPPGSSIGASSCSQPVGVVAPAWNCLPIDDQVACDASAVGSSFPTPRPGVHAALAPGAAEEALDYSSPELAEGRHASCASLVDYASVVPDIVVYPAVADMVDHIAPAECTSRPIATASDDPWCQVYHLDAGKCGDQLVTPSTTGGSWTQLKREASAVNSGFASELLPAPPWVPGFDTHSSVSSATEGEVVPPMDKLIARSHADFDAVDPSPASTHRSHHVEFAGAPACYPVETPNSSVVSPTWLDQDVRLIPGAPVTEDGGTEKPPGPQPICLDGVLVYTAVPAQRYPMDDATRISGPSHTHWEPCADMDHLGAQPPMPTPADSSFGTPNEQTPVHVPPPENARVWRPDHLTEIASTVATGVDRQSDAASTVATDGHVNPPLGLFHVEQGPSQTSELSGSLSGAPEVVVVDLSGSISAALAL